MTTTIQQLLSYISRPTPNQTRAVRKNRICYFLPIYARDGYKSQGQMDFKRWGASLCNLYANSESHPLQARGKAAMEWKRFNN